MFLKELPESKLEVLSEIKSSCKFENRLLPNIFKKWNLKETKTTKTKGIFKLEM